MGKNSKKKKVKNSLNHPRIEPGKVYFCGFPLRTDRVGQLWNLNTLENVRF
jgi:hypothetical protein